MNIYEIETTYTKPIYRIYIYKGMKAGKKVSITTKQKKRFFKAEEGEVFLIGKNFFTIKNGELNQLSIKVTKSE